MSIIKLWMQIKSNQHNNSFYHIELSMNPNQMIQIDFKTKPLLSYEIEEDLCIFMKKNGVTKINSTRLILNKIGFTIKCYCRPKSIEIVYAYENPEDDGNNIIWLTDFYNDPYATITDGYTSYIHSKTWRVADYLGHLKK